MNIFSLSLISMVIMLIDISLCQQKLDSLNGHLLQTGELLLINIEPKQQIEYYFKTPIAENSYNVVLSFKKVVYSQSCETNYEFQMNVQSMYFKMFVIEIEKYECLEKVEIQWFAYSYQNDNESITYFKQQKYQKNIEYKSQQSMNLSQQYIFDASAKSRKVESLLTGFVLPPHLKVEQIVNREYSHRSWTYATNFETNLIISSLQHSQNQDIQKISLTINFLITHPNIFNCQSQLSETYQLNQSSIALQNIQYLDSTLKENLGYKKVCYFKQYSSQHNDGTETQTYKPIINTRKQQNGTDPMIDDIEDQTQNTQEKEKDNEKEKDKQNENSDNGAKQDEIIQIILLVSLGILVLGVIGLRLCKQYIQNRQQQQIPHIALNDL